MYKVISFGHRCSSAIILKRLGLKTESYPFDWLVSKLDVIKDCIETRFAHFLNENHYITKHTRTVNIVDDIIVDIAPEVAEVNTFYETDMQNVHTYSFQLALNHHNLRDPHDREYYRRCIDRLYALLETDLQKIYLYLHPIMGVHDFQTKQKVIVNEFDSFNQFIRQKTQNIFGIYFIFVRQTVRQPAPLKSMTLKETPNYCVFVINCNEAFIDENAPFAGDHMQELKKCLRSCKIFFPHFKIDFLTDFLTWSKDILFPLTNTTSKTFHKLPK